MADNKSLAATTRMRQLPMPKQESRHVLLDFSAAPM